MNLIFSIFHLNLDKYKFKSLILYLIMILYLFFLYLFKDNGKYIPNMLNRIFEIVIPNPIPF